MNYSIQLIASQVQRDCINHICSSWLHGWLARNKNKEATEERERGKKQSINIAAPARNSEQQLPVQKRCEYYFFISGEKLRAPSVAAMLGILEWTGR